MKATEMNNRMINHIFFLKIGTFQKLMKISESIHVL
jgi:hypothetical protein